MTWDILLILLQVTGHGPQVYRLKVGKVNITHGADIFPEQVISLEFLKPFDPDEPAVQLFGQGPAIWAHGTVKIPGQRSKRPRNRPLSVYQAPKSTPMMQTRSSFFKLRAMRWGKTSL